MRTYNLKLTCKQVGLVQSNIYDLCNYVYKNKISDYTTSDFAKYSEYDNFRIKIYFKEQKLNKNYFMFVGLTEEEMKFMKSEIDYWTFSNGDLSERDPKEASMARRIRNNIDKTMSVEYQRNQKLNDILN